MRDHRGISQVALAKLVGISPGYIGLVETGEREHPSLEVMKRLAQALRADLPDTERLLRATGYLADDESLIDRGRVTFGEFVRQDRRLTGTQQRLLIALYESWLGKRSSES